MLSLRGPLALLVALAVVAAIVAALTGLLLAVAVVAGLILINLLYLPRAATWLRLPVQWLALGLLPIMLAGGLALGGVSGAVWGTALWLAAIGLPRVLTARLVRRLKRVRVQSTALEGVTCPRCGMVSFPRAGQADACARCAQPLLPAR